MTSDMAVYAKAELEQVAYLFDHWRHQRATQGHALGVPSRRCDRLAP